MLETNLITAIPDLLKEKHLLSASEILKIFLDQGHSYNKTSVYRALDQLVENNTLCRHHFTKDEAKYELREHHHVHLVCTNCGSVSTGECSYVQPDKVGSFTVDHHHTTLFGMCEKCQ